LELIGNFRQAPPGHPFPAPVDVEKAQHTLGLLERLDQSIQQDSIKAAVSELNAILVMLDEGVHGPLLCGEIPGAYRYERLAEQPTPPTDLGYQGRSPWLVRSGEATFGDALTDAFDDLALTETTRALRAIEPGIVNDGSEGPAARAGSN
jgi:hypothetical protein